MRFRILSCAILLVICAGCGSGRQKPVQPEANYHYEVASTENILSDGITCYAYWFHADETMEFLMPELFDERFPVVARLFATRDIDSYSFLRMIYKEEAGEQYSIHYRKEDQDVQLTIESIDHPEVKEIT